MSDTYIEMPAFADVNLGSSVRLLSIIPTSTTPSAREMLEKIYHACGLNPNGEASTVECSPPQALVSAIPAEAKGLRIAVFGLSPKQIGALWSVQAYQWVKIGDQFWCFAERLEDLEADINKKKQLWNCLKILKEG